MKYKGQRPLRIILRTIHILSIMYVSSDAITGQGIQSDWLIALVASGCGLVMDDFIRYGTDLFRYLQFWSILPKIPILVFAIAHPNYARELFIFAIIIGAIISHAPGNIRQFALHGKPGPCASKVKS